MYNTIYIRMVVGNGERSGGAEQALRALAILDEGGVDVRRSHLKEVRKLCGGDFDFSAFNLARWTAAAANRFTLYASTFRDSKFREQVETTLNKVAEKVRDILGDDQPGRPFIAEFEAGEKRYQALIKPNRAYVAAWDAETEATQSAGDPLQITTLSFFRYTPFLDTDLLLGGRSARGHVAAAFMIIAAQDMLEIVRLRQSGMLIRTAVRNWSQFYRPGYPNAGTFMYKQNSTWFMIDSRAGDVPLALKSQFEDARRDLRGRDMARFEAYADRYEPAALLIEMRKIAVRAGELSKRYADWLANNQRPDVPTETVAETVAETVGPGDGLDLLIGAGALAGGDDICFNVAEAGNCGGKTEVAGGTFNVRIRASVDAYIRAIGAAMAADSSLPADQIKKLYNEFDIIFRAFQYHVGGSLSHVKGEKWLRNMPDLQLEDRHKKLSGLGSDLAVLQGQVDALKPEEDYVTARDFKYGFLSRNLEIGGQQANVTMVRMKEKGKKSKYLAFGLYRLPDLWPPRFML